MAIPLRKQSTTVSNYSLRSSKRALKKRSNEFENIDAVTLASSLQLEEENRELIYSSIAFLMKLGLLAIGIVSLFNLGFASNQRIKRHGEISSLVKAEAKIFRKLHSRFDNLFTIGGKSRFMDGQDQWIEPNSIRVIWR